MADNFYAQLTVQPHQVSDRSLIDPDPSAHQWSSLFTR